LTVDDGNAQLFLLRCIEQHTFHVSLRDPKVLNAAVHLCACGNSTGMYAETEYLGEGIALVCVSASDLRWNTTGLGCK
jgi:hypothetical protein